MSDTRDSLKDTVTLCRIPFEVWTKDTSWLRGPVPGVFFYLYFVMGLYSRKIVGCGVYENEFSAHLVSVIEKAYSLVKMVGLQRSCTYGDGIPMKGVALATLCNDLEITTSHSEPRVSDDNPHIEAEFKTTKYWSGYSY